MGSSSNKTAGRATIARASAIRCRSPLDKRKPVSPKSASSPRSAAENRSCRATLFVASTTSASVSVGFYSSKVDEGELDPAQPWLLTDYVDATHDVTVAVVRDELFAFELDRTAFIDETIDWRRAPFIYSHRAWKRVDIPAALKSAIFGFMAEVGQHFARIDFLRKNERYIFLEANYNGEWGWLDPDATEGLMAKVIYEIDPDTPCVSCPQPRW